MISAVFVDRPRLAIVIAILMTLAGVLSLLRIPVAQFPDIVPPQVTISTSYAGASAAVVEATVAQPLEAQIVGVDKMIYMKSSSGNDGSYSLTVSFELGTNPDIDTVNVNNRVQQALSKLPPEVQRYGLTVRKRSAAILEFLQFYSEGGKQDPLFISNYVTINVLDRLARTPGVGDALLFGRLDYSMRIWFDMNRLISLNLAPSDIIAAIQQQNVQAPVGRIGARPTSDATQFQLNVQTQGRLITAEQFGHIVIRANPDGSVLRLSDIARVELGAASMDTESRLNGDPAVSIGLYLAPGANAVQTSARVQAALDELGKRFPDGLKSRVFYDSSSFVAATIDEVEKTLAIAFALVVLVVFLFLGNIRATIIPMVAIPVSLIGTFAVLLAVGFSANTVSLLALVLGIGVVVDDAIVVVENVERVMAENPDMPPGEATKMAMRQITGPVIAISLVLLSVFVPVGFIPGVSGSLFRQFAVTISVAMLISAINALTLSPALCGVFLRHHGRPRGPLRLVLGGIDAVRNGYAAVVHRLLRVAILSVLLLIVAGVGIWLLAARTPTGFLPEEDQGAFFVAVQLPDGASVSRTRAVVQQIEGLLAPMPQVAGVLSIVGFSLLDGGNEPNAAFVVVRLKPFADRTAAADSAQAVIGRVFGAVQQVRSANAFPFNLPPIIGLSTSGGFEYQLENLEGRDPAEMASVMQGLLAAANQDPRMTRVFSTFTASNPSIWLDIDREKAQALGLNIADVFNALQSTLGGFYVNDFNLYGRTWQVNIQGNAPDRSDVSAIYKIYVRNRQGEMVPLRSVADLRIVLGPQVISRFNNYRAVTINGGPRPGRVVGRCAGRDGAGVGEDAAAGLCVRMVGHGVSGEGGVRTDRRHPVAVDSVRLPVPGGAVRELDDPDPGAAVGDHRRAGRVRRDVDIRPVARSVCADRPGGADLAGGEERHPDRRVRQGAARGGTADPGSRGTRRAHPVPRGDDDVDRVHLRPDPAGVGRGRGDAEPSRGRHRGVRRHDRGEFDRRVPDPDAVRGVPGRAGSCEGEEFRRRRII